MIVDDLSVSLKPDVVPVKLSIGDSAAVSIYMVRLDCIVPFASGNKIYKLVGNLDKALQGGQQTLLSFGGAYSNHIHALALTSKKYGLKSIGIIRGEEVNDNPTLNDARAAGMQIIAVSRATYRRRYDSDFINELQNLYPDALIIPEGGANKDSLIGVGLIPSFVESALGKLPHTICCAAGTGATATGIALNLAKSQSLNVYPVVRDDSMPKRMDQLAGIELGRTMLITDASFGGYAKLDKTHIDFILEWLDQTGVLLDPIYTSKLCRKVLEQLRAGVFQQGACIVLLHTGGLQGWRGYQQKVERLVGQSAWRKIASFL